MHAKHDLNFSQQHKLFDPTLARPVHLIGAGSVGSHIGSMLARIGVTDITAWDDDSIDSHNIGPSLYGVAELGRYKVDALRDIITRDTGLTINVVHRKYAGEALRGSVIAAVDNMGARQLIWESVKKKLFVDVLLDTRVAEHFFQVFATRPTNEEDIAHYEAYLSFTTEEAHRQMCGLHSIVFIASRVAGIAVECLCDLWSSGKTKFARMEQVGSDVFIHPTQEFAQ